MSDFEERVEASLKSINAQTGRTDNNVNELLQWKAALDVRCEGHREQTTEVRETLYGNPNGVVKSVNSLLNSKKSASKWKDLWMYVLKIVIASGILALAGWLLLIYKVIKI